MRGINSVTVPMVCNMNDDTILNGIDELDKYTITSQME